MKTVLELGRLESEGIIDIENVQYMTTDEGEKPPVSLGYTIKVSEENQKKVPQNLLYNEISKERFGVFI